MMREVWIILRECALRHWRLAWRQQLMLLAILALGTAVHTAMRLANRSALAGFTQFTDGITREPDWTVRAAAGPLKMEWLSEMRAALGARPVTLLPLIEATVTPHRANDKTDIGGRPTWRLLGMDLVALQNFARADTPRWQGKAMTGNAVFVSEAMATREGWKEGGAIALVVNDAVVSFTLAGIMPSLPDAPAPPSHLLLMDLSQAQQVLGRKGDVDRVEVIATDGPAFPNLRDESQAALASAAKNRWQVSGREDRRVLAGTMTAAFRLNLTILSLLALLVGGYLMFQALDGVVIRRREEIAILRSLGVTERGVKRAFLIEAGLLGVIAGILGVALGWLGAQSAVLAVSRTMTALYGASTATFAELHPGEAMLSIVLCIATSLVAAWWPARTAAMTQPAAILSRHAAPWHGGRLWRAEWIGVLLCIIAVIFSQMSPVTLNHSRVPLFAYAAALSWLLGAALAGGAMLRVFKSGRSAVASVAFSHLRLPSVRHRFAIAALVSAVAMTTGMAVMVASFDHTMQSWITRTMKADIYLSSAGAQSASSTHTISAATIESLRKQPLIREIGIVQQTSVLLSDGPVMILGIDVEFATRHDLYAWVMKPTTQWTTDAGSVLINESLSTRLSLQTGDHITIPTPGDDRRLRIAGIYADYGNERGSVTVPRARFGEWFGRDDAWRVGLMLQPDADEEKIREEIQRDHPGLSVFTQQHLRSEALRIFRQTFAVTYALEAVGVIVAVAGLGLALASLMLDRRADLTTLRAMGFAPRDVAASCAWEGFGTALAGVITGLVSGLWLGWLLIARVNKQAFGWTLSFDLPAWQLTALGTAVLIVGVLVSAMVGRWASKLPGEQEA
jgi:putative ABC transport system permease protein